MDNIESEFEKKPKKKIGLIISLVVIALVIIGLLIWFFIFFKSPKNLFSKVMDGMINEIESTSFDTYKLKLNLGMEIDSDEEEVKEVNKILKDCIINIETQLDLKNKKEIVNYGLDYKNENAISAKIYYDEENIYLYLDEIYDKYIQIDVEQSESFEEMLDAMSDVQSKQNDIENAIKIAAKELKSAILEQATFSKKAETIEIDGKDTKVTKNIMELNAKQLGKVIKTVCKDLKDNKEFLKCFEETPIEILDNMEKDIELDDVDEKNKITISIYTKGFSNEILGTDFEIYNADDDETTGLYIVKEDKNTYSFKFEYYETSLFSRNKNVQKINGTIILDTKKEEKEQQEGTITLNLELPDAGKIKLNLYYNIELNKPIDTIKIKNPVKLDEITDKEKEEIIERLYERPLIGEIISNAMNESIFTKANTAANNTRITQINEAIALTKADLYADYYDPSNLDESKIYGKTMSGVLTTYQSTEPTKASVIEDRINYYLDSGSIENSIKIKVSYANGIYTVKLADGVIVDFDDKDINSIECNFWK